MALSESQIAARLCENLAAVQNNIAAAAARSARAAGQIMLVGVTKYVEPTLACQLVEAGLVNLGESRPQELWRKAAALQDQKVFWHLIGHLQRNKVKRTLPLVACIHSADSLDLLQEIDRQAAANPLSVANVLLEINVSGDAAKHGFQPGALAPLLPQIALLKHVSIRGLMTMASLEGGLDKARRDFAALRELADTLKASCPPSVQLQELSMGMSHDFEVAIEEGATIVRVGSALLEGLG